jgi:methyl-accepting chemotaxis protein
MSDTAPWSGGRRASARPDPATAGGVAPKRRIVRMMTRAVLSVTVLLLLASVITIFFVMERQQQRYAETVQGNFVWSAVQIEKEAMRLERLVAKELAMPNGQDAQGGSEVSDRFDILFSRIHDVRNGSQGPMVEREPRVASMIIRINASVIGMAEVVERLDKAPDRRAVLRELQGRIDELLPAAGELLLDVHRRDIEEKYVQREQTTYFHRMLAAAVAGLTLALLCVMVLLVRHMQETSRTNAKIDAVERENLAKSVEIAQRDEQAALMRREAAFADRVNAFNSRVNASVTSLASMIEDITGQCMAMAKAAERARLGSEEAAASSSRLADHVSSVALSADAMSSAARDITRKTIETSRTAHDVHDDTDQSGQTIRQLVAAAAQIDSVTQLIASVAGRTNLLALNAAIEAARAGESGRGFAVVAGEVKSLASQTAAATSEIARQIEAIQTATTSCVAAMDNIRARIGTLSSIGQQISRITEDQSQSVDNVATMIREAAAETTRSSSTVRAVMEAAEHANAAADAVLGLMVRVNDEGRRIRREIEDFRALVREPFGPGAAA